MRELTGLGSRPRDERGASAVIFGLLLSLLVGGLGLSLDVGNVAYERTKAQHAADAAARHLAYQCAAEPGGAMCLAYQASAKDITADSISGASAEATPGENTMKVDVTKTIDTHLLALIGVEDVDIAATATARVGAMQPTEAYDILPLGVHYCTWKNWSEHAGTPAEDAHKTTLRTDLLQGVENLLAPVTGSLRGLVETKELTDELLLTDAVARCDDAEAEGDQVLTLNGASWITPDTVVSGVVGGLLGLGIGSCELDVGRDVVMFLRARTNSGFMPPGCPSKFGNGKLVEKDKTILLPVLKPRSALQDRLDLKLRTCASLFGPGRTCAQVPPEIGVEVVGFAPFHVTGWEFPGNNRDPDLAGTCQDIDLTLNLRGLVASVLGIVEGLVNATLGLLGPAVPTNLTATIDCAGLQGYFTKTFTKDPDATYELGGEDFGASYASLID